MGSKFQRAAQKQLLKKGSYPTWLKKACQYETMMGSTAYGCSSNSSDIDIYGFFIPPKRYLYPHTEGYLLGFDEIPVFDQWQQHHVKDTAAKTEYDFSLFNIVKYFKLCLDNNPNIVDSLFTPGDCILHITPVATLVREKRDLFLSKKAFHKFTGYLHSQIAKLQRSPDGLKELLAYEEERNIPRETTREDIEQETQWRGSISHLKHLDDVKLKEYAAAYDKYTSMGKRTERVKHDFFDRKFSYQAVRLACEIEQVLEYHTIDMRRDREIYKAIRRGDWSLDQVKKWLAAKELTLNKLYETSKLRNKPATQQVKQLLLDCLETYYGSISEAELAIPNKYKNIVEEISQVLQDKI